MHARNIALLAVLATGALGACKSAPPARPDEPQYTIVRPPETAPEAGGIPPEKQVEIQLVLQQRDTLTRKCYQDVLSARKDRAFKGTVMVLIRLGTAGKADEVRAVGGTLGDAEVTRCLVDTVRTFEFPALELPGEVQYTYAFEPAY
jgi:hypothetical protein